MFNKLKFFILALSLTVSLQLSAGSNISKYYEIDNIPLPKGEHSADAIAFMPDGRLVCALSLSKIYFYDTETKEWSLFAEGLHTPLGISPINNHEIIVSQRPEITRIIDTDKDGKADHYKTESDYFGITGTYGEWAFGPVKDSKGNIFFSLGSGSMGGVNYLKEIRGEYSANGHRGRMTSMSPFRGWVMKITPDGKTIPWTSGTREPNGLGFDLKGNLFVSDNQGDWVGSSALYHVKKGQFYGWAPSLAWKPGFTGIPIDTPVEELDEMRTRPAIVFPHGDIANSPSQPLCDTTEGKFGPFSGQMFIGEMNKKSIIRVSLEEVDGQIQGACIPFYDNAGLKLGNNRLAFNPKDGSLWVGQTKHGFWAGNSGLQRISWKKELPLAVTDINLTETGFKLTFTKAVDKKTALASESYKLSSYFYNYHGKYGSDPYDKKDITINELRLTQDGKVLHIDIDLAAWRLYDFTLPNLISTDGHELINNRIVYTLNRLLSNTPPPPSPIPTKNPRWKDPKEQLIKGPLISVGGPQGVSGESTKGFKIQKDQGGHLISENGKVVLRYNEDPISRKDGKYKRGHYIHPLFGLDGTRMTDDMVNMGRDHPHHRGVFWAWSQLWLGEKQIGQPWEQKGLNWNVTQVDIKNNKDSVTIASEVTWNTPLIDKESGGKDLVHEDSLITIHKAEKNYRRIDFKISLLALEEGVRIGGANTATGYGGFSVRTPLPRDMKIKGPGGEVPINLKGPSTPQPWVDFSGSFKENKTTGLTLLTHPSNPGFPNGWTLRKRNSCQNPVFPGKNPITLDTKKPLILQYSIILHGDPDKIDLNKIYESYSKGETVKYKFTRVDNETWRKAVKENLPQKLSVEPKSKRKALIFSISPGYKHQVIPFAREVMQMLSEKTGACELISSNDIGLLEPDSIKQFDAIIFNNSCSHRIERNLFRDILVHQVDTYGGKRKSLSLKEREEMAARIENGILDYVSSGKGMMILHGGITMMNNSSDFSSMMGASFNFHPKQQTINLHLATPTHPLLKGFEGKTFTHFDEPYMMKGAYDQKKIRPLLYFNGSDLKKEKKRKWKDGKHYVSWIKSHGKGRIFYVSPSHNKESYMDARLLQFYLDGLQYTLGDLDCDDSPKL